MNLFKTILVSIALMAIPVSMSAVTDAEMEQARAITAITYLRYANDASGYLDDFHPKTMAELQKVLKDKEKENLKTFTAVKTPTDYASWDKKELVEYWGGTFYNSPGLLAKGKVGKSRTRSRLQAMSVATPASAAPAATPQSQEQTKPEEPVGDEGQQQTTPLEEPKQEPEISNSTEPNVDLSTTVVEEETREEPTRKKGDTWIYVAILAVLVIVVVALVIYASNAMKQENVRRRKDRAEEGIPVSASASEKADKAAIRHEYSEAIARKNEEIHKLTTSLEAANREIAELKKELQGLRQTNKSLQQAASEQPAAPQKIAEATPAVSPATPAGRTIYLGRVNSRGLFVRADKNINPDLSVYMLQTNDGFTGTFRVLQSTDIDDRLLENPGEWLSGGCQIETSEPGATKVHTVSGGTAIFESGVWKVMRKAKVIFGH